MQNVLLDSSQLGAPRCDATRFELKPKSRRGIAIGSSIGVVLLFGLLVGVGVYSYRWWKRKIESEENEEV